jgi:hypothetical protein
MRTLETYHFDPPAKSYLLIDKSVLPTPVDIFSTFPHQNIIVLDFALKESALPPQHVFDRQGRFIASLFEKDGRSLLNIDHHNETAGQIPNFSTTHQVISALAERQFEPQKNDQLVIINHDDTDSVLALLLATHAGVPLSILDLFSEAATVADHTGAPNTLVNIIDACYRYNDIPAVCLLINAFIQGEALQFPDKAARTKFQKYETLPTIIASYIQAVLKNEPTQFGAGTYDPQTQILWLEPLDQSIDTIRALPIAEQLGIPIKIIMTSEVIDPETGWSKISLRSGAAFPEGQTLEGLALQLNLEKFGYGGRRNAGGIGRYQGEKIISPSEMFELLQKSLS